MKKLKFRVSVFLWAKIRTLKIMLFFIIQQENFYKNVHLMNSSNLLKLLVYLLIPYMEKSLKINSRQIGFRPNTNNCQAAHSTMQEIVKKHCAIINFRKAFDRINFSILISKLKDTHIPSSNTKSVFLC